MLNQWIGIADAIIGFIPALVVASLAIVIAWIIGKILERLTVLFLEAIKFDELLATGPISPAALEVAETQAPATKIISVFVFWATFFFTGLAPAANLLGLSAARALVGRLISFVPLVLASLLTVGAAVFIAALVREAIRSILATSNLGYARELGWAAYIVIALSGLGLALKVLRVSTPVLMAGIGTVGATVGLALAIGFGLGAREALSAIAAGRELKHRLNKGDEVAIDRFAGTVEKLGLDAVDLRTPQGMVSIPNSLFLQRVVVKKESPPKRAA